MTALADTGLRLDFLHEFDFVEWPVAFLVEGGDGRWRLPEGSGGEPPAVLLAQGDEANLGRLTPEFVP